MKRREAVRRAVLMATAMALGKMDLLKAEGNGQLIVPLDQWGSVVFIRKGRKIAISVDEIFKSLQEGV